MNSIYKPNIYAKDIHSIDYQKLKKENYHNLLFDIDNTIATTKEKTPKKEVIELFEKLKKQNFKIFIISNALPGRVKKFSKILKVKGYYLSGKPLSYNYKKIIKDNNLDVKVTAAIGDQIYTDIKGANKLSIKSILVDRISKKEAIFTKFNRLKENQFIYKTNNIKRGEYYD